jgi:hypothetical protein
VRDHETQPVALLARWAFWVSSLSLGKPRTPIRSKPAAKLAQDVSKKRFKTAYFEPFFQLFIVLQAGISTFSVYLQDDVFRLWVPFRPFVHL